MLYLGMGQLACRHYTFNERCGHIDLYTMKEFYTDDISLQTLSVSAFVHLDAPSSIEGIFTLVHNIFNDPSSLYSGSYGHSHVFVLCLLAHPYCPTTRSQSTSRSQHLLEWDDLRTWDFKATVC